MTSHDYLITKMAVIFVGLCTESNWRDYCNADNKYMTRVPTLDYNFINLTCYYGRAINDDHGITLISPITHPTTIATILL